MDDFAVLREDRQTTVLNKKFSNHMPPRRMFSQSAYHQATLTERTGYGWTVEGLPELGNNDFGDLPESRVNQTKIRGLILAGQATVSMTLQVEFQSGPTIEQTFHDIQLGGQTIVMPEDKCFGDAVKRKFQENGNRAPGQRARVYEEVTQIGYGRDSFRIGWGICGRA